MSMLEWAKQEVEIAKKRERGDAPEEEWDYGCACYDSALKAFESLCEDGHSGTSIGFTKQILNRLIDGKALTPIEDTDDIWNEVSKGVYQNKRTSSLFKDVDPDGNITYSDNSRVIMVDIDSDTAWHCHHARKYIDELHPIMMPYIPPSKPYKVYERSFMYHKPEAVGEYDHYAMLYFTDPDGKEFLIDKYFMETEDGDLEISKELWEQHYEETFGRKL